MVTIKRRVITKREFEPIHAEVTAFVEAHKQLPTNTVALDKALVTANALTDKYVGLHINGIGIPSPVLLQELFNTRERLAFLKQSANEIKKKQEKQLAKLTQSGEFEFNALATAVAAYRIELGQNIAPTRKAILQEQLKSAENRMKVILLIRMTDRKPLESAATVAARAAVAERVRLQKENSRPKPTPGTNLIAPTATANKEPDKPMTQLRELNAQEKSQLTNLKSALARKRSELERAERASGFSPSSGRARKFHTQIAVIESAIAFIENGPETAAEAVIDDTPYQLTVDDERTITHLQRKIAICNEKLERPMGILTKRKVEAEKASATSSIEKIKSGEIAKLAHQR
jgi:hypothetical protein